MLTFKSPPNFEARADANQNNVYEVTVVATDTADERGTKSVMVKVTNVDDPAFDQLQRGAARRGS